MIHESPLLGVFSRKRPAALAALMFLVMALMIAPHPGSDGAALAQTQGRDVSPEMPVGGNVPGGHLGTSSDAEFWRAIRGGVQGTVSIPDKQAGQLVQSGGDNWRAVRNGPLTVYGAWIVLGSFGVIALFFAVRGRIRIDSGLTGETVERFSFLERTVHWITASSFIVLALTGLNSLYGRHLLLPILGKDFFSVIAAGGKYLHNYLAFAFMVGVVMMFVLWVRHNIPNSSDLKWLAVGGGLFSKGLHPPAKKFNAGQKLIFWLVIAAGVSLSTSGIALLFPFQFAFFEWTFAALNLVGLDLPTELTPMAEMQLSQLWHAIIALILIGVIVGHIYIGSLGMEGAFDAMGSGQVDCNWAREHHSVWMAEVESAAASKPGSTDPAE